MMGFKLSVRCPGCGRAVPLDVENPWVLLDKPYCSPECADEHALAQENVLSEMPEVPEAPEMTVGDALERELRRGGPPDWAR